jgi:hypothetical protein
VHRYTLDKQSRLENEHECVEQKKGEEEGKAHSRANRRQARRVTHDGRRLGCAKRAGEERGDARRG